MDRLEFYLDIDCELKKTAGGMDNLILYGKMLETFIVLGRYAEKINPNVDISKIPYDDPQEGRQMTLWDLKQKVEWMLPWQEICDNCPYAFRKDEKDGAFIGCFAGISYPIGNEVEALILVVLQQVKDLPPGDKRRAMIDYILNYNITGRPIAMLRAKGTAFLEDHTPVTVQLADGRYISTDQVLEVLFKVPNSPQMVKEVIDPFMMFFLTIIQLIPPEKRHIVTKDKSCVETLRFAMGVHTAAKQGVAYKVQMITCVCGSEIRLDIPTCPNCGRPIPQPKLDRKTKETKSKPIKKGPPCKCGLETSNENPILKCSNCGAKFCQHEESYFRRGEPRPAEEPLQCYKCYKEWKGAVEAFNAPPPVDPEAASTDFSELGQPGGLLKAEFKWAALRNTGRKFAKNSVGMLMTLIEPGEFRMGLERSINNNSGPVHWVRITKPFFMSVYPVTRSQWQEVMKTKPSKHEGDDIPVDSVSWSDCQLFIKKLAQLEPGSVYRLPTEAEWEYACRAGTIEDYFFGDDTKQLNDYAWWRSDSDNQTHPVGSLKPNAWCLYDMLGNVNEWVIDTFKSANYKECAKKGIASDPVFEEEGKAHILRGGSYRSNYTDCRSGSRAFGTKGDRSESNGFRIVRTK